MGERKNKRKKEGKCLLFQQKMHKKKEKRKRKKVLSLGCTEIKFHYSVN
jgi:hypothetical protein